MKITFYIKEKKYKEGETIHDWPYTFTQVAIMDTDCQTISQGIDIALRVMHDSNCLGYRVAQFIVDGTEVIVSNKNNINYENESNWTRQT